MSRNITTTTTTTTTTNLVAGGQLCRLYRHHTTPLVNDNMIEPRANYSLSTPLVESLTLGTTIPQSVYREPPPIKSPPPYSHPLPLSPSHPYAPPPNCHPNCHPPLLSP
eukprot:926395-Prorocentrum_minimum.AAC.2